MKVRWTASDMPSQTGRTWLITGATSGIGLEAAKAASRAGARLILAVRNVAKGEAVAASLDGAASVIELDLGSLASIRRAAEATPSVDVLVNNAGRVTTHRQETEDGFECLLGTNALGPFAYTNLVAEKVADRVVIVGSGSHKSGVLDFDDPHFVHRRWTTSAAYSQSKLADMVWGLGLSRRLTRVDVQLCHQRALAGRRRTERIDRPGDALDFGREQFDLIVRVVGEQFCRQIREVLEPAHLLAASDLGRPLSAVPPALHAVRIALAQVPARRSERRFGDHGDVDPRRLRAARRAGPRVDE